jgi:SAM-dependent methyltransferase
LTSRWASLALPVLLTLAALISDPTLAQDFPKYGDEIYQPRLRQPGKDVMWLPTPDEMVTRMLDVAKVHKGDLVYDLGAGEGRLPIAAAKRGATAVGIEYDPAMAALARRNAARAGVADKVTIITGDIFKEDFSKATVVTLYLLPELNLQMRPQLLAMKPGTRIVSHQWDMGEWEADEAIVQGSGEAFLWIVPANVAGRWTLRDERGWDAQVDITQRFQRIGGTITVRDKTHPLLGAYVTGPTLGFTFEDADATVKSIRAQVDGERLAGQIRFAGNLSIVTGRR